ncbi:hypothetical protein N9Y17_04415, partial [Gammaproteobacteria bacterium]|nr:hypothetical protein [Gammaproteobacteria bacterium]
MKKENPFPCPLNTAESELKGITKLDVYVDEQKKRAQAAKVHIKQLVESSEACNSKLEAKKDYLTGQYKLILAEDRNFSASDQAYLNCIKHHEDGQEKVSISSVDDLKYWVLACQDQGIHSFIMTGITAGEKNYVTAIFGKNIIWSKNYFVRKARIQNEHWLLNFKDGFKFRQDQKGKPYQVHYKGYQVSENQYNSLLSQIAIINPAIPVRVLQGDQEKGLSFQFSSLQAQYIDKNHNQNRESREKLEKKVLGQQLRLSENCRESAILMLQKFVNIDDPYISSYGITPPSKRTIKIAQDGTVEDLRLLPQYQSSQYIKNWDWFINNKRYIAQLVAVSATYLLIHSVFSLGASLFFFDWVLLVGIVSCYELNCLFTRDPYPVTASFLTSLLMMILLASGLLVSINASCWVFCAVMLGCASLNWLTHQDRYQMAGFFALSSLMFLFSGMGLFVPMNVGFNQLIWHSTLPSLFYALAYYATYHLIPRNPPSPINHWWNKLN